MVGRPAAHAYRYLRALHSASGAVDLPSRTAHCARGARSRLRNQASTASRSCPGMATHALARARGSPTCSPAQAWMKPGRPACIRRGGAATSAGGQNPSTQENLASTYEPPPGELGGAWSAAGCERAQRFSPGLFARAGRDGFWRDLSGGRLSLAAHISPGHRRRELLRGLKKDGALLALETAGLCTMRRFRRVAGRRFPSTRRVLVTHQDALLMGGKVQAMRALPNTLSRHPDSALSVSRRPASPCVRAGDH